ncbi:MAG: hypothetical protein MJ123_00205 [Lachnospiraceae bacterium]|nr:hypothetical protein [Lachnospiraceae bacterium]
MINLRNGLKKYSEYIFGIYMVLLGILISGGFNSADMAYKVVFVICGLLWGIKLLLTDFSVKEIVGVVLIFVLLFVTFLTNREKTLILTAMAITGAKDVNLKKTFLWALICKSITTIELMVLASLGFISNTALMNTKDGVATKNYCLGYQHPNLAFLNVLTLAFLVVLIWGEKLKWYVYLLLTAVMGTAYYVFKCRTGMLVWIAFIVGLIVYKLLKRLGKEKVYLYLFGLIPVVLSIFTAVSALLYKQGNSIMKSLNFKLHDRIAHVAKYPIEGINLFGSHVRVPFDNGFYHLVYNYGFIMAGLFMAAYTYAIIRLCQKKMGYEVLVLGLGALVIYMEFAALSIGQNYSLVFLSLALFGSYKEMWGNKNVREGN